MEIKLDGFRYMTNNVLAEPQRESAGASTFGKYNFQYHWALCRIIEKHQQNEDYGLLIEYHEDVVIADSLDSEKAGFEFYQVKNQTARFTEYSLTNRGKPGLKSSQNSVLGKLLSSCIGTQYENKITKIGLVSSSGFSLGIDKGLRLDVISTGDLTASCLQKLTDDIKEELGIALLPKHLQFIVPEVKLENQEDYVLGQFARLVDNIFSGARCNAVNIYRAVIDEMGRKGRIQVDYKDWKRLIENKSLTSDKVQSVLTLNTSHPCADDIKEDFNLLAKSLNLKSREGRYLRSKILQLSLSRTAFMTAYDINIVNSFKESLGKIDYDGFSSDYDYIEALTLQAKVDGLEKIVPDSADFRAEIIYYHLTIE